MGGFNVPTMHCGSCQFVWNEPLTPILPAQRLVATASGSSSLDSGKHLYAELTYTFTQAHVNLRLRPEQSKVQSMSHHGWHCCLSREFWHELRRNVSQKSQFGLYHGFESQNNAFFDIKKQRIRIGLNEFQKSAALVLIKSTHSVCSPHHKYIIWCIYFTIELLNNEW